MTEKSFSERWHPGGSIATDRISVNFLFSEHFVYILKCLANEEVAALVTCKAARDVCAVVTAALCFLCGNVARRAASKLNKDSLLCKAACADPVAEVEEELKGAGNDGDVAKADNVDILCEALARLLHLVSRNYARVDVHLRVVLKGNRLAAVLVDKAVYLLYCVLVFRNGNTAKREGKLQCAVLEKCFVRELTVKLLVDRDYLV